MSDMGQVDERKKFCDYMWEISDYMKEINRDQTAGHYFTAMRRFFLFLNGKDVAIDDLTADHIERFASQLENDGLVVNSISFYMRTLRAAFNRAVDEGLTEYRPLFKRVPTSVEETRKRALSLPAVKAIRDLELEGPAEVARDMFMLSFHLQGMAFVDLCHLKKGSHKDGLLTYRRHKTRKTVRVAVVKEAAELIEKYRAAESSPFLLNLIRCPNGNIYNQYVSQSYFTNKHLKKVGKAAGLEDPLTFYMARHSWASAARSLNVPMAVISECMGHSSEQMTRIYLASMDSFHITQANETVTAALSGL